MTRRCALVIDSGAVIGADAIQGVTAVPLRIAFDHQVYRDGVDISPEEFYARLGAGETPTTSTPSPGEYLDAFRASDGERIVCLTIPRKLSAMYESATLAARLLADEGDSRQVDVIDTGQAAAGFGLVARAAAELCAAGAPGAEVLDRVSRACAEVRMYGSLRTLRYLARSGRVPSIAAGVSDLLGVRPIFELRDGDARRLALVRGERRVVRDFQRIAAEQMSTNVPLWLLVFHSGVPESAARLREALHQVLRVVRSETITLTPVMGAYTGPGMSGFAAMPLSASELGGVP
jgi:DegV family protein with EDD domain